MRGDCATVLLKSMRVAGLVVACMLIVEPTAHAKPEISRASIKTGQSMRASRNTWSTLACHISNPDKRSHEITLRLVVAEGFSLGQRNVFSEVLTAPPETAFNYRTPVMIESSEKYRLDVFVDGDKQAAVGEDIALSQLPGSARQIGVVTDLGDASLGAFNQLPAFKDKIFATFLSRMDFPETWLELRSLAAIVLVAPDYSAYNARQFQALLDYVARGGIVVFSDPQGTLGAAQTPWAELLPVKPVRLRKVLTVKSLETLVPEFKGFPGRGADFLESIPSGSGVDLLSQGEFPVFRWKKYGLGSCRFSAVPLYETAYERVVWEKLLKIFFNSQTFFAEYEKYQQCLDELTGFPVPGSGRVKKIFVYYFLALGAVMGIGILLRRRGLAWAAATVVAVVSTLLILMGSNAGPRLRGKIFSALDVAVAAPSKSMRAPTEAYCSLFTDAACSIDLPAPDEDVILSSIPPDETSMWMPMAMAAGSGAKRPGMNFGGPQAQQPQQGLVQKSLDVQRRSGVVRLNGMTMSPNTTRQFSAFNSVRGESGSEAAAPELTSGPDGLKMKPWVPPTGVKAVCAFLLTPGMIRPLKFEGGHWSLIEGSDLFTADAVAMSMQNALSGAFKSSTPCVALVSKGDKTGNYLSLPSGIFSNTYKIKTFPAIESCGEGVVQVGPELVLLSAGGGSSRMIMSGNHLKETIDNAGGSKYPITFEMPPAYAMLKPDEIVVNFVYRNPGGNIIVTPLLGAGKKEVTGVEKSAGVFVFKGSDLAECLDPCTGKGILLLDIKERTVALESDKKLRGNKWNPVTLTVAVKGHMPNNVTTFNY